MTPDIQGIRDMLSVNIPTWEVEQILIQGYNINEQDAKSMLKEALSEPIYSIHGTRLF